MERVGLVAGSRLAMIGAFVWPSSDPVFCPKRKTWPFSCFYESNLQYLCIGCILKVLVPCLSVECLCFIYQGIQRTLKSCTSGDLL